MAKKKYVDDDIREEIKGLTGISFSSEEELQKKLEEIHRKKNANTLARIMRVCGFVFALILFIASFDVFFEGSVFGAWFDKNSHNLNRKLNSLVIDLDSSQTYGYVDVTVKDKSGNVIEDLDFISEDEYRDHNISGNVVDYEYKIYTYRKAYWNCVGEAENRTSLEAYARKEYHSPDIYNVKEEDFETNPALKPYEEDWKNVINIRDNELTYSSLYDDRFYFGPGMPMILMSVVLITLAVFLAFISAYMIKDIIDVIKGLFYESRNVVTNVAETAVAPFKKIKKVEKPEESERTSKSLFDDEDVPEKKPATRKKKTESEKPERKKDEDEFPHALTEEEINALLNPDASEKSAE